jgi:hypothetical protein
LSVDAEVSYDSGVNRTELERAALAAADRCLKTKGPTALIDPESHDRATTQ